MAPTIDGEVNVEGSNSLWPLGNDDACPALVEFLIDPVAVKSLVGKQVVEVDASNERRHTDGVIPVAGQQNEAHEMAECICQREDFGRPTAFRFADGLFFGPPFAP